MEVVKAFITLKPGFTPGPDLELEIMNFIRKKLSLGGNASGYRVYGQAAKNKKRKDYEKTTACKRVGRGDWRYFYP